MRTSIVVFVSFGLVSCAKSCHVRRQRLCFEAQGLGAIVTGDDRGCSIAEVDMIMSFWQRSENAY